ncbi:transposase DDE domain protein [Acinetobacter baumannii 21072]|uniref:Transposase DDE domain protein n=1 Tax=Acinetobacter baumannii 21072 TaxID=1310697 RepID=A0A062HKT0_ACIBA|nr:transposase DDE domain protein [Acinetobacter baumannii 21072]
MDSTGMKFLGEGEWKRKKYGPEYRRQWRKLHIGIDAKTFQIRAIQLTTNNVSDSQVLGDLLDQIPQDERLTPSIPMELMIPNSADRSLRIGKHMQ